MVKQIQVEQEENQIRDDHAQLHRYVTLYLKDVPVQRFGKQRERFEKKRGTMFFVIRTWSSSVCNGSFTT